MRILVTGASGFIGRHLVRAAVERGHTVAATSRQERPLAGAERVVAWDPAAGPAPAAAFEGADAVVHLAGESVGEGRWTKKKMARIRASREIGTRNLVAGIGALPEGARPRVLASASAVGYYGDRGDQETAESAPPGGDFLAEVAVAWEREALGAQKHGLRVAVIRTGIVLGTDGGALPRMLTPFRFFVGGPIGGGGFWWPWIHVDDLVALYFFALENDAASGPLNGTSPNPATNREFAKAVGGALGRPSFMPTPWFMLRIMIGKFANYLTCSQKVVPERTQQAGFEFKHPKLEEALKSLLQPS